MLLSSDMFFDCIGHFKCKFGVHFRPTTETTDCVRLAYQDGACGVEQHLKHLQLNARY